MTRKERRDLADLKDRKLSVKKQAELLGINRSSLYYQPVGISPEELELRRQIDEIYTKYPYYGARKIARILKVNRKIVQRLMLEMGSGAIRREYTSLNILRDISFHTSVIDLLIIISYD